MTVPIRPAVSGIAPLEPRTSSPLGEIVGSADKGMFRDLLTRALGDVNAMQDHKDDLVTAFLRGEQVELHDLMAAAEEASISLELLVETRNKLTDAYRSIMNMQV